MARGGYYQNPDKYKKNQVVKLCLDSAADRAKYEEIANNPRCKIKEKVYNSTNRGVQWMTILYEEASFSETR